MEVSFYTISVVGGCFLVVFFLTYGYLILNNTRNYSGRDSLSQSCVKDIPDSQLQLPGPKEGFQELRRLGFEPFHKLT